MNAKLRTLPHDGTLHPVEREVILRIIKDRQNPSVFQPEKNGFGSLVIKSREVSGIGLFVNFETEGQPGNPIAADEFLKSDFLVSVPSATEEVCCTATAKYGKIAMLEFVTGGGTNWDGNLEGGIIMKTNSCSKKPLRGASWTNGIDR